MKTTQNHPATCRRAARRGSALPHVHQHLSQTRRLPLPDQLTIYPPVMCTRLAARYLGVSIWAFRHILERGELRYTRPALRIEVTRDDLDAYIASHPVDK